MQEVIETCEICQVYKKAPAEPYTSFPRARAINESVAIDLNKLNNHLYFLTSLMNSLGLVRLGLSGPRRLVKLLMFSVRNGYQFLGALH